MGIIKPLNIFYEEPDPDRWFKYDRYPRKLIRRIVRGKQRPGGVMMVALELMRGLDKLHIPYRFNDYRYIQKHPDEIACIIGKPQVLQKIRWKNPIIFGAGIYSHPRDFPDLLERFPNVKKILVPGPWMKTKFDPYYGAGNVRYWPVGIDAEKWHPQIKAAVSDIDFLIYDKVRWKHDEFEESLINPIIATLKNNNYSHDYIRYGKYTHAELIEKLAKVKAVIFLCEHETQGLAYQQILATGTPILAWDRGGYWQDPSYYPEIKFGPVSSVPYWDEQCGEKFKDYAEFSTALNIFMNRLHGNDFNPRKFILENLTLEKCAAEYLNIVEEVQADL